MGVRPGCGGTTGGQENQLGSPGIMINVIALGVAVYIQAASTHLAAKGYPVDPADVARLTPLGHPAINLDGRYRTTSRRPPPDSGRYESAAQSHVPILVTGRPAR
jgi:Tn3 transposase DDE domain